LFVFFHPYQVRNTNSDFLAFRVWTLQRPSGVGSLTVGRGASIRSGLAGVFIETTS
jgi:hypothetical protein